MLVAVVAGSFTSLLLGSLPWFPDRFLSCMSLRGVPGSKDGADTEFAGLTAEGGGGVGHLERLHRGGLSSSSSSFFISQHDGLAWLLIETHLLEHKTEMNF